MIKSHIDDSQHSTLTHKDKKKCQIL